MNRWKGKVALVTGAASGIGKATAVKLVLNDMIVVGCDKDYNKLKDVAMNVNKKGRGEMLAILCDVTDESQVQEMFRTLKEKFGSLHVCVNSAGLAHDAPLLSGSYDDWVSMVSVNVLGLCLCTRESFKLMEGSDVKDGHIIHINSMSGHRIENNPGLHFYACTKFAVTALAEGLRQELRDKNSRIRSTSISPGDADTDFLLQMFKDPKIVQEISKNKPLLDAVDIANAVLYVLSAPPGINVNEVMIRSTDQKS